MNLREQCFQLFTKAMTAEAISHFTVDSLVEIMRVFTCLFIYYLNIWSLSAFYTCYFFDFAFCIESKLQIQCFQNSQRDATNTIYNIQ